MVQTNTNPTANQPHRIRMAPDERLRQEIEYRRFPFVIRFVVSLVLLAILTAILAAIQAVLPKEAGFRDYLLFIPALFLVISIVRLVAAFRRRYFLTTKRLIRKSMLTEESLNLSLVVSVDRVWGLFGHNLAVTTTSGIGRFRMQNVRDAHGAMAAIHDAIHDFQGPRAGPAAAAVLPAGNSALDLLKQRFAKGEIDEAEFQRKKALLA